MSNGFIISKETWDAMPDEQRSWIMFETMQGVDVQLKSLKRWNKASSFVGGVIGGVLASLGVKWSG